ncbi:DUF3375 domain-containing protein [Stenotrophomonas sp. STM01]|uniref:DUF3375 domain-containing protein n=1 Tax=Stenotrophomonas sp. STM01 TaxID=2769278 RepID=UPI00177E8EEC|nr:DUF3375 domain-containing protein [Stenotrophomonas sp. STM01]MBD9536190.1 DUF3375 domain-containing protein [Stenotrophomonas sp. STM01]
MKYPKRIAGYQRLREQPLWKLLASDRAPVLIGLLQGLLLEADRRVPGSILAERLQQQLDALNAEELDVELPRTAQAYIAYWLSQGWLERRLPEGASEEEYELSRQAVQAIRFIAGVEHNASLATESRLSMVMQQLSQLAQQTETNPEARLAALRAERERIDAEIAQAASGKVATLDGKRALERTRDVIRLADDLAEDFRRVRDDFEQLNRRFRERIIDDEGARGDVLDRLFSGVDVIGESDAGRSFQGFWDLLNDPRRSAELDAALDAVLERGFTRKLDRNERNFLRNFTSTLLERGGQVHEVMQHFARSLRGFVQSRGYLEQRRLNQLLKQAQGQALQLREDMHPTAATGFVLPLSAARLRSIGQWRLHDPRSHQVETSIFMADAAEISLDSVGDLVAQSEIDVRTLKDNLFMLLGTRPQLSIAQVLRERPARQGLGSVIGYLSIGTRHGMVVRDQLETVEWTGGDGRARRARVPLVWFLKERRDELV